jgi:hypothetical protein
MASSAMEDDATKPFAGPRPARWHMPHQQRPKPTEQRGKLPWAALLGQVIHTHKAPQEPNAPRVRLIVHRGIPLTMHRAM